MEDILQLKDKHIVVMGVANERSLAWGVAKSLAKAGAKLTFTYRKERSYQKLTKLFEKNELTAEHVTVCDINEDESIKNAFADIHEKAGRIDGVVHSIAFAHGEDLKGAFVDTSRSGYAFAQDTSAYSLIAVSREAKPYMTEGGAIITMSALGGERTLEGYKVMGVAKAALESSVRYLALDLGADGIRVNTISAGPIRTLAAKGIPGFNDMLHDIESRAPLKRNVTQEEVGDMAAVMMSPLSRGVTGETVHVDAGYNIMA
ncbi:enoyl-ACP reductase FabI [Sediminibacillus dalangtanensis]|uniref:Enoyl-[acyl-carrier-protein] reductase [NADH] n=1 Tax=Sediminibacillus dalangtanensis TaxID=2729421 RepID=A0ABX7VXY3_9BACI|nr:enoyl-ACP reductase FabI [Sediminibacillus dalangtanensis]QTM99192.1 enoyl-ACP reductase FabI [Sediminibacillus dalangtanensis]